jgi:hypothetical protein
MRRAFAFRWFALLAAPLLMSGALPARALLRCAMDGSVRVRCCCPEAPRNEGASLAASEACCCSVASDDARPLPPTAPRSEASGAPLAQPMLGTALLLPRPDAALHELRPAGSSIEPALGPPIVLLKRSLLI